jgi:hypothetical protein
VGRGGVEPPTFAFRSGHTRSTSPHAEVGRIATCRLISCCAQPLLQDGGSDDGGDVAVVEVDGLVEPSTECGGEAGNHVLA